jgi:hypothetical protein
VESKVGISNCMFYRSLDSCLQCYSKYYLQDNSCVKVEKENLVNECTEYTSQ